MDKLTAAEARRIAYLETEENSLYGVLEAIKENALEGEFKIYMSAHHKDLIPALKELGYSVDEVSDNLGKKYIIGW